MVLKKCSSYGKYDPSESSKIKKNYHKKKELCSHFGDVIVNGPLPVTTIFFLFATGKFFVDNHPVIVQTRPFL